MRKEAFLAAACESPQHLWTWTALDADSKLIVTWLVGERDAEAANQFIDDLAQRIASRIRLTTYGDKAYLIIAAKLLDGSEHYVLA